ncbi:hypothetical protein LCGC14_2467530 [marine sediment metagenome]|uniref:Uncharacterized protein n=1 Tax=marine sediment metagenome TaxID=412755 RepID=A0A0F9BBG2_9ZZZZ
MRRTQEHASRALGVTGLLLMVCGILGQTAGFVSAGGPAPQPATANVLIPVKVGYAFVPSWRLGAPAFVLQMFSKPSREGPVVYVGKTVPRGLLVLRSLQKADGKLNHGQCAVRSKEVDITSLLQVIGAQYHKVGDNHVQWVPADKLPKLKVRYEPLLPKEISFPGKQNCVLLYEIGQGRENEWREGYWAVSLRFDVSSLNMRLKPQGSGGVVDPAKKEGLSVIYTVRFLAKTVRTEVDKHNLLYHTYLNRKASGNQGLRKRAIEPLSELIRAYPSEANLLYARAKLLAEYAGYARAIKDLDRIEVLVEKGTPRSTFVPPTGERGMSKKQVISILRGLKRVWSRKATTQPATQPAAKPPGKGHAPK